MKQLVTLAALLIFVSSCVSKKKYTETINDYQQLDSTRLHSITSLRDSLYSSQSDSVYIREVVIPGDTSSLSLDLATLCDSAIMAKEGEIIKLKTKNLELSVKNGVVTTTGYTQSQVNTFVQKEVNKAIYQSKLQADSISNFYETKISNMVSNNTTVVKTNQWRVPIWMFIISLVINIIFIFWIYDMIFRK